MHKLGSLSRPSQFRAVLRDGRRLSAAGLETAAVSTENGVRIGLAVRAANSVERNRVKRRIRAAFLEASSRASGADVVIRADQRILIAPFQELVGIADRTLQSGRSE